MQSGCCGLSLCETHEVMCMWVCRLQVGDAKKVKVYGPAVEAPVTLHQLSYLIVDCKEAGPGTRLPICPVSGVSHQYFSLYIHAALCKILLVIIYCLFYPTVQRLPPW